MGRYYSGDIEGKFWFGLQCSTAPERFCAQEQSWQVINYYIDRDDLPKIKEEIEKIENDPEVKKIIDLYKNDENFGLSNENIEKHALTRKAMEDYADLLLGKQIYDYFDFDPERHGCEITAEY